MLQSCRLAFESVRFYPLTWNLMLKIKISLSISMDLFYVSFPKFSDSVLKHTILNHVRLSHQDDFSMPTS